MDILRSEPRGLVSCREQFPALQEGTGIYCDGAAGTQVPRRVTDRMAQHLNTLGSTNVGGDYNTSQQVRLCSWLLPPAVSRCWTR